MQPVYASDYVEQRSRLTTFFRIILIIPHLIVVGLWGIAAGLAVIVAWFAIVITGRYPRGLFDFVAGWARANTAFTGYYYLLTDVFPPFDSHTDDYPVRLHLGAPLERYSRLKALFRIILAIPVYIGVYVVSILVQLGAFVAWFVILVLGRQPEGLHGLIDAGVSYWMRATAYLLLLSEDWPPIKSPPELRPGTPPPSPLAAG